MNVLFVNHTSYVSGAEIVLLDYLREEKNFNKYVFVPKGNLEEELKKLNISGLFVAKNMEMLKRSSNKLWIFTFLKRYFVTTLQLIKIIKQYQIDILYANTYTSSIYCLIASIIMKKPLIWHMHDIFKERSLESKVARIIGRKANVIVAVSHAVKKYLVLLGIKPSKIKVVYNGIDYNGKFNPNNYTRRNNNKIIISMFGLVTEWKGTHILVDAIGLLNDALKENIEVRIVGDIVDPSYGKRLNEKIKEYNLQNIIYFLGRRDDIPVLMKESDIIIHASVWEDPLPTVLLEAMSMKRIVIGSNVGGVPEIIKNSENGFIFERKNVQQLSDLISQLIHKIQKNDSKLQLIKEEARKVIKNKFSPDVKKSKIYEIIKSLENN